MKTVFSPQSSVFRKRFSTHYAPRTTHHAPYYLRNSRLKNPLVLLAALLLVLSLFARAPEAATLKAIRNMSDPVNVKIVLAIEGDVSWSDFVLHGPARLVVDLGGAGSPIVPYESYPGGPLLEGVRAAKYKENMVRVVLDLKYLSPYHVKKTQLGDVEIYIRRKIPEERKKAALAPGVIRERVVEMRESGPLTYHAVEVDPGMGYRIGIAGAAGGFGKLEKLSSIVDREGALLGVNGGYFDMKTGMPIGLLVAGGQVLATGERYRAFFGVDRAGAPVFMMPNVEVGAECGNGRRLYVHRLNAAPKVGERAALTSIYKGERGAGGERWEYVVHGGVVREMRAAGGVIPAGGFVLSFPTVSAPDRSLMCGDEVLKVGDALKKLITSWPDIGGIVEGFSAGPLLVEDGARKTSLVEDFTISSGIVSDRNPRTAVGVTGNGRMIFIVVEGRSVWSAGLFLDEVAELLVERGAKTGMNLDGGGSSEIYAGGKILNRLSDGKERSLSNAILIYKKL
ncbi:MAG: phosphodiester glycosidase family protein [bacterium]